MKNVLNDPVTLTFDLKTVPLLGYPKVISYTKFEPLFDHSFLSYVRTNKQTDSKILPTLTDIVAWVAHTQSSSLSCQLQRSRDASVRFSVLLNHFSDMSSFQ